MHSKEKWIYFDWAMVVFTACLVALRVGVHIRTARPESGLDIPVTPTSRTRRRWWQLSIGLRPSDILTIIAWIFIVLTIVLYHIIIKRYPNQLFNYTEAPSPVAIRLYLISQLMDTNSLFAVKMAVLLTYREFIYRPVHYKWLTVLMVFTGISWVVDAVLFAPLLSHAPDPSYFDHDPPLPEVLANNYIYYTLHFSTDILIYIFPIPTIILPLLRQGRDLPAQNRISTGKKIRVSISFLMGFLCIATAAVNLLGAAGVIDLDLGYVLDTVEQVYAITVVCAPTTIGCMVRWYYMIRGRDMRGKRVSSPPLVRRNNGQEDIEMAKRSRDVESSGTHSEHGGSSKG